MSLSLTFAPSAPEHVVGDPLRIRQVVSNLVSNAIKFTEEGSVSVHVSSPYCDTHANRHHLHFSISDTGMGIAESLQPQIFSKFTQADETTTRQFGGTGSGFPSVANWCI